MTNNKQTAPSTLITFEIGGELRLNSDNQPVSQVTITARRGELGYVSEVEMTDFAAGALPIIAHINSLFFNARAEPLPDLPDFDAPPEAGQGTSDAVGAQAEAHGDMEDGGDYSLTFYEPDACSSGEAYDETQDRDPADRDPQLGLW